MAMDVHVGSKGIHQHSSIIKGLNKISGSKTLKKLVSITCECTKLNPEWHKLLHHMCECMWKKEAIWKSAPSWSSWWVSRRSIWGGKSPKRGHRKKTTCWTNAVLIIHKWLWIGRSSTPDLLLMSFFLASQIFHVPVLLKRPHTFCKSTCFRGIFGDLMKSGNRLEDLQKKRVQKGGNESLGQLFLNNDEKT